MNWRPQLIQEPNWEAVSAARSDYERLIVAIVETVIQRWQADPDYAWIDTKFSSITGEDFQPADDPARNIKGKDVIYGWVQGRGLETLSTVSRYIGTFATLTEERMEELESQIEQIVLELVESLRTMRSHNGDHMFFMFRPDGTPLELDDEGLVREAERLSDAANFSDMFCAKGIYAAANMLGDDEMAAEAIAYLRKVLEDVRAERFYNDQQPFDPKTPVRPVPGRHSQAPWMISLGALAMLQWEDEEEWYETTQQFIRHIIDQHINTGQYGGLEAMDWIEAVDDRGNPWKEDGRILSDIGHCLEFVGLASKATETLMLAAEQPEERVSFVGRIDEIMLHLLPHNFQIGYNFQAGGICKSFDLVARKPINSDMPWWSLPETMRAACYVAASCADTEEKARMALQIVMWCSNSLFQNYVNPNARLFPVQTRNEKGEVVDVIPGMPDADPGYHTCLPLIDVIEIIEGLVGPPF